MRRWLRAAALSSCALLSITAAAGAQESEEHARLRWEWFYRQRAYPFGEVPAGALQRARAQLNAHRTLQPRAVPPIRGTSWQPIGPRAIPIAGTSIGRISTIAIHPTSTNTVYIGGAQGGVWRTTDGGANWTPLTDKECSLAMGSIAIDRVNPSILYAATGEQHFSVDSYYGCGVLRSADGGSTWTRLGASVFVRSRIARILIVPSTAGRPNTTLLVASDNGLWRSTDSGSNWTQLRTGTATDLVLDPTDERIVYTAIRTQGVFRSADGGQTWEQLRNGLPTSLVGRINLAIAPTAPRTLFAAIHNTSTGGLLGIWKSTDAGVNWSTLTTGSLSCGTQCWYDMTIEVSPTSENTVYFGGLSLYRSLDGGTTWSNIGAGIHVDQHYIVFDPLTPTRMYVANDGGIYRSNDAGTTWTSLNAGLELTQFYPGISLHPSEYTYVLGGTQDNGTVRYNSSPVWAQVNGADGGYTAIHPDNPLIQFVETQWDRTGSFSGPRRSDGGSFVRKVNGITTTDPAQFIPPLVMDATDPQVLYFGTNRLYRTANSAESWSAVSPVFATNATLTAIASAPSDPAVVYVGLNNGQLHVTRNTGEEWAQRTSGIPTRFITDIAVDRADAQTAYATVSGFGTGHVFRTTNAGQSWTDVSSNLPDIPVNAVLTDPVSRAFVMLGTDLGVFMSADSGRSWTVVDQGMPNVAVFDLAYNPATASLVAATHGRGMFQLQLDRPLTLAVVPRRRRDVVVEGATGIRADSASVVLSGSGAGSAGWSVSHSARATWLTLAAASGAGTARLRWTRRATGLAPGVYIDTIRVVAASALDSPALLIDSLIVEPSVATLSVSPRTRRDTVSAGQSALRPDSASVLLPGMVGTSVRWTAAVRKGNWISLTTAGGTGPGVLRWSRNPASLNVGVHVDTLVITADGAVGSPAAIVDSLIVLPVLALVPSTRRDTLLSGASALSTVTAQLNITGDPGGTVAWTVSKGAAPWLTLSTTSGRGHGPLSWTRSAANLRDGVYVDTITVSSGPVRATLVDTLVVAAPAVTQQCVADHLFGKACLDATQLRWLDLAGNRDGSYNLGDLVAYLRRASASAPPVQPRRRR